jgi:hypothetical protein
MIQRFGGRGCYADSAPPVLWDKFATIVPKVWYLRA